MSDLCTCTTGIKVKSENMKKCTYIYVSFTFAILKNIYIYCKYIFPTLVIIFNQPIIMLGVITANRALLRHHKAPPPDNICSPDARSGRQETRIRIYILLI